MNKSTINPTKRTESKFITLQLNSYSNVESQEIPTNLYMEYFVGPYNIRFPCDHNKPISVLDYNIIDENEIFQDTSKAITDEEIIKFIKEHIVVQRKENEDILWWIEDVNEIFIKAQSTVFIPLNQDGMYKAFVKTTPLSKEEEVFFEFIGGDENNDNRQITIIFDILLSEFPISFQDMTTYVNDLKKKDPRFTFELLTSIFKNKKQWTYYTKAGPVNKILRSQECNVYIDMAWE
jgi:hypothetical protein